MKKGIACILAALLLSGCTGGRPVPDAAGAPDAPNGQAVQTIVMDAAEDATPVPTAIPAPTPTAAPAYAPLTRGTENADTAALTARLCALGYLPKELAGEALDERALHGCALFAAAAGIAGETADTASAALQARLFAADAPACTLALAGYIIGLDPGHQAHGNSAPEPVAPGASETKKKVSSGTSGIDTRVPEYQVNLAVGLLLRDLLAAEGAIVVMTHTEADVDISNSERAVLFNTAKTDYALRLHCNGSNNHDKRGAFMLIPKKNPFSDDCRRAAELLIDAYCSETGLKNLGITVRSDQTGFNWCERMIVNIEMGHMTNAAEDRLLTDAAFQQKMAKGLCAGIVAYFAQKTAG